MNGGFWSQSRKMGRSGFHNGLSEAKEKLTKEVPQQLAQNRDKLKKEKHEKKAEEDRLPGGRADNEPDKKFPKAELKKGQTHEREHTNDPGLAKEIAKDHLEEDKKYYDKLEQVEKKD